MNGGTIITTSMRPEPPWLRHRASNGAPHVYLTQMAFTGDADQYAELARRALEDADRFDGRTS